MGAAAAIALVSSCVALVAVCVVVLVAWRLAKRTRDLAELLAELRSETLPLVRDARSVVDHAATEMERVGDVLGNAEAVSATVDSASRLAYRAFSNPVVKTVAFGSGLNGAVKRLVSVRSASNVRENGNGAADGNGRHKRS